MRFHPNRVQHADKQIGHRRVFLIEDGITSVLNAQLRTSGQYQWVVSGIVSRTARAAVQNQRVIENGAVFVGYRFHPIKEVRKLLSEPLIVPPPIVPVGQRQFFNFTGDFMAACRREGEAPPEPCGAKCSNIEAGRTEPSPPKHRFDPAKVALSN